MLLAIFQFTREFSKEYKYTVGESLKKNHQVGEVLELRGKRAVVKIGLLPMQVEMKDLVVVKEKIIETER